MSTTTLNTGHTVLAKTGKYGLQAIQYTNSTQAIKKASQLQGEGVTCWVLNRGIVKYIVIG